LLALCTAFVRYRRAALPFVPVAVALTFGFAIPLFGQSIAHAPGLIIGLLFVSAYMAAGIDRAPLKWQFAYAFVAGGVGFYFDLLNGDILAVLILFSLVRLISILAFDPPTVPSPFTRLPTSAAVVHIMAGFVTGAVSMAVWRIVLRAMLTGQSLFAALAEWRAQLSKFSSTNWAESQHVLSRNLPADQSLFHHWYYDLEVATFPYIGRHGTLFI
jgi:hypothetical protein